MARTTLSHGITFSWSLNAGLKRPFSSKTETQARTLSPVTTPSEPTISLGPQEFSTAMPSCSASSTSLCQAGICWRDSRLTRQTCSAPDRIAMRAASKAGCKLSSPGLLGQVHFRRIELVFGLQPGLLRLLLRRLGGQPLLLFAIP